MVPVIKNLVKRYMAKNYCPVSLLSVVSKVFEKLVNNRTVDHLEKCGCFSDFQYGFRFSWLTAGLLIVVSDRIAIVFTRPGATGAVVLDMSKAFNVVWKAGFLHQLTCYELLSQIFVLFYVFLVIDGFEWFWTGHLQKNILLMVEFHKA